MPTTTRGARRGSTASDPTLLLAVTRADSSGVASNRSPSAADTGVIRQLAKITPNHSLLIFPSGTESARPDVDVGSGCHERNLDPCGLGGARLGIWLVRNRHDLQRDTAARRRPIRGNPLHGRGEVDGEGRILVLAAVAGVLDHAEAADV